MVAPAGEDVVLDPDPGISLAFVNAGIGDFCRYLGELSGLGCEVSGPATAAINLDSGPTPVDYVTALELMRVSIELAGFDFEIEDGRIRIEARPGLEQPPTPHTGPSTTSPPTRPGSPRASALAVSCPPAPWS